MSKPRLKLDAVIDTLEHADTIEAQIRVRLIGKDIFEMVSFSRQSMRDGTAGVFFDCRFNSGIDTESVKDWIQDTVQNHPVLKTWVKQVRLAWHLCSHDEATISNCRDSGYAEWNKP